MIDNSLFVKQLALEERMRRKLWELVFELSEGCPANHFQRIIKPACEDCTGEYWNLAGMNGLTAKRTKRTVNNERARKAERDMR